MKQYFKDEIVFVPDPNGEWTVHDLKTSSPRRGRFSAAKSGIILITEEELLDLMQEAIEHSHTTLLRENAAALLKAKLQQP